MGVGGLLFFGGFLSFLLEGNEWMSGTGGIGGFNPINPLRSGVPGGFLVSVIGMAMLAVGGGLRSAGRAGIAGSGLTLDPR